MDTETLRPNDVGTSTTIDTQVPGSLQHYDKVDEVVADEAVTYIRQSAEGTGLDTYGLPDSGVGAGAINHVTVYARCTKIGSGDDPSCRIAVRTEEDYYYGSAFVPDTYTDWSNHSKQWTVNPETSSAWTWVQIDALEAGIEMTSSGDFDPVCTQVYVEVDYTPVTFISTVMII